MNLSRAYYWGGGVRPGMRGSALVSGHSYARGSAEFNPLWRTKRGMRIRVGPHIFKVTKVEPRAKLRLSERKKAELRSRLGKARVVFTTCNARTYNFEASKYRHRVLVYAKKVS